MSTLTPPRKAEKIQRLDSTRKAHHAALSSLHGSPLKMGETHEGRGLKMWRKLRRIESVAHDAATAQCNGTAYNGQPFRDSFGLDGEECDNSPWDVFTDSIRADVAAVFGGSLPAGFRYNQDPRGYALKIYADKGTIPQGMVTDWGGYGILAAEIND